NKLIFSFQAGDGIRYFHVTGVQTCALPILTKDVEALVLRMASLGRRILSDDDQRVVVEAEAGEPWHPFVLWTLEQGLVGLENLRSEEHTSELQSRENLVCRLLPEKKHIHRL